jgi:lipoprotein-releasing system permease protein
MNLSFFIARKYFLSKKKRSFIHFISLISMLGVGIGLAALIIILSVFNGLEDLNRQIFKSFDPDLKISARQTKSFSPDNDFLEKIRSTPGVDYCTEIYQDKALAKNQYAQTIVDVKGVDSTFSKNAAFRQALAGGEMKVKIGDRPAAFIGAGVYNTLELTVNDFFKPIEIIYPKNEKLNVLNPENNVNRVSLEISGVFVLEQHYDNFVYLPIEVMEELMEEEGKRTALEITLLPEASVSAVKARLKDMLPENLEVKDRDEQNASLLRAIRIEKLFIFIGLIFVVGIAAFNIFYGLSMLVLDKKDDIATLSAMGATPQLIRKIFFTEGFIIAGVGIILGLILGLGTCFLQERYGFIGLGMDHAITDAYPVRVMGADVVGSVAGIVLITFLASLIPSTRAINFMLNNRR